MELERMAAWKNRLEEFESGHLPFMCLQYKDKDSIQHTIPAVFIGNLNSFADQKITNMVRYFFFKKINIAEEKPKHAYSLYTYCRWKMIHLFPASRNLIVGNNPIAHLTM
jgi:hypothetical protein